MADPEWKAKIEEAIAAGEDNLLVMPEWIRLALQQWIDATRGQVVTIADFAAYVTAVTQKPIDYVPTEEEFVAADVLDWMPSSVSDAMSDLAADLKKGRET